MTKTPRERPPPEPNSTASPVLAVLREQEMLSIQFARSVGVPEELLALLWPPRGGTSRAVHDRLGQQLQLLQSDRLQKLLGPELRLKMVDLLIQTAAADLAYIVRRMSKGGTDASKRRHAKKRPDIQANWKRIERRARELLAEQYGPDFILDTLEREEDYARSTLKKNLVAIKLLARKNGNSRG